VTRRMTWIACSFPRIDVQRRWIARLNTVSMSGGNATRSKTLRGEFCLQRRFPSCRIFRDESIAARSRYQTPHDHPHLASTCRTLVSCGRNDGVLLAPVRDVSTAPVRAVSIDRVGLGQLR